MVYDMDASSYRRKHKRLYYNYHNEQGNKFLSCYEVRSVDELLEVYPKLRFIPHDPFSIELWKDIIKNATPKNYKKRLQYDPVILNELMTEELDRTVWLQNILIRALKELGNNCTKVELLKLVTRLSNSSNPFCLGGGSRPDTKRLILMYEVEADVTAKKRKSYKRRAGDASVSVAPSSDSSSSSSSSSHVVNRAHSLAYGDGYDENMKLVTGMSLKHIFDEFNFDEYEESMHNMRANSQTIHVSRDVPSHTSVSENDTYRDTQELFEELMEDFQPVLGSSQSE